MSKRKPLQVGERVRLRRHRAFAPGPRQAAKIWYELSHVKGGVVLDTPLEQLRYWNVSDLERAPVRTGGARAK